MNTNADIAVAEEQLKRVRRVLMAGVRLQRNVSLENHDKIIRFNAVADSVLGDFPSVSVEDYQVGEDIRRRVVSLEGLLDSIKKFILGEKKKDGDAASAVKKEPTFWNRLEWLDQEVQALVEAYEEREGTITIPARFSAWFPTNGKLSALLKADVAEYRTLFNRAKPELDKQKAFMREVDTQGDKFAGDVDRPDEFLKWLKGINAKQTIGLSAKFTDSTHVFLGYGKEPFLSTVPSNVRGQTRKEFYYAAPTPKSPGEITLPFPSKADVTNLVLSLKALCETFAAAEQYMDDYPIAIDLTDPPYRGYYDIPEIDDELAKALWIIEIFEPNNTNFINQFCERTVDTANAMLVYLERVLK